MVAVRLPFAQVSTAESLPPYRNLTALDSITAYHRYQVMLLSFRARFWTYGARFADATGMKDGMKKTCYAAPSFGMTTSPLHCPSLDFHIDFTIRVTTDEIGLYAFAQILSQRRDLEGFLEETHAQGGCRKLVPSNAFRNTRLWSLRIKLSVSED